MASSGIDLPLLLHFQNHNRLAFRKDRKNGDNRQKGYRFWRCVVHKVHVAASEISDFGKKEGHPLRDGPKLVRRPGMDPG